MRYIKLRMFDENDIDRIYEITSDKEIMKYSTYPWSWSKTKNFIDYNLNHDDDTNWKVKLGDEIIGIAGFDKNKFMARYIPEFDPHFDFFFYIYLDTRYQGKGYGVKIYKNAIKKLNNYRHIYASIYSDNMRSVSLFRKLSFFHYNTFLIGGKHIDVYKKKYNKI